MRRALATCAIGAVLAGIGALSLPSANGAEPLTVTVGTLQRVGSLDRRHGDTEIAREVWNLQYPTLASLDPKTLDPVPGIAAAWSPAPKGSGWIYKLRTRLAWSDGKPVTAADVVYSLDHAVSEHWKFVPTTLGGLTARAINEHTVEITAPRGSTMLPGLELPVVPAHVYASSNDISGSTTKLGVADGTWHVTTVDRDSVQLDANGTGGPAVQRIVLRHYADTDALIAALEHGRVNAVSDIPDADIAKLEALTNVTVDHAGDGTQYVLRDDVNNEGLRQAASLAIDRDQLVTDAVHGVGTPGVVPIVARGATWALADDTVQSLTTALDAQPERAHALAAARTASDRTLSLAVTPDDTTGARVRQLVARSLAAAGITTTTSDAAHADLVIARIVVGDDPFPALETVGCTVCPSDHPPYFVPRDFTAQVAQVDAVLQQLTEQARVVGLFQPDTLQAFRSDHVTGWLPEPQQGGLVVFGPTVAQYGALSAARVATGEKAGNGVYALGAVIVLALCAAVYWFASRIRRRYVGAEGNDVSN